MMSEQPAGSSMPVWIALLRGINVGGKNILPMKELVKDLQSLNLQDVQTYIQSGNVVFRTRSKAPIKLEKRMSDLVEERYGFRPHVLILSSRQLNGAIASNPFPKAEADPKSLHLFFLAAIPKKPNMKAINELRAPTEQCQLGDRVFYLHAPDGIGRSKLAAKVEKLLGVPGTGRNWNTVKKLQEMMESN